MDQHRNPGIPHLPPRTQTCNGQIAMPGIQINRAPGHHAPQHPAQPHHQGEYPVTLKVWVEYQLQGFDFLPVGQFLEAQLFAVFTQLRQALYNFTVNSLTSRRDSAMNSSATRSTSDLARFFIS